MIHWFSMLTILIVAGIIIFAWVRKIVLTYALIIANLVVLVLQIISADLFPSSTGSVLVDDLAFRTIYVVERDWAHMHTVITAAFLHAGLIHFIGNAIVIFIAGVPFEERLGRGRFLALYLFSAFAATMIHGLWTYYRGTEFHLLIPALGASGAAFGILGGFATAYPNDKFPIFPIPLFVFTIFARNVPVIIGVLLLVAVEGAFLFAQGGGLTGVANAAHVGGAIGGTIAAVILRRPPKPLPGAQSRRQLDYAVLERLATDPQSQTLVQKVKENSDIEELQRAWLDRLIVRLRCPQCGHGYSESQSGVLECDNGHRERYAR